MWPQPVPLSPRCWRCSVAGFATVDVADERDPSSRNPGIATGSIDVATFADGLGMRSNHPRRSRQAVRLPCPQTLVDLRDDSCAAPSSPSQPSAETHRPTIYHDRSTLASVAHRVRSTIRCDLLSNQVRQFFENLIGDRDRPGVR